MCWSRCRLSDGLSHRFLLMLLCSLSEMGGEAGGGGRGVATIALTEQRRPTAMSVVSLLDYGGSRRRWHSLPRRRRHNKGVESLPAAMHQR